MRWAYLRGRCVTLTDTEVDLLADILQGTYEALKAGLVDMSPAELEDFNSLCNEAGLTLHPLDPAHLPGLRRIK